MEKAQREEEKLSFHFAKKTRSWLQMGRVSRANIHTEYSQHTYFSYTGFTHVYPTNMSLTISPIEAFDILQALML